MKDFKAIVIGHNHEQEKAYNSNLEDKQMRCKELFIYLNKYVSLDEIERFEGRILDEFYSRCYDKYNSAFPTLSIEKVLDLNGCQIHRVESLINAYESIDLNWNIKENSPVDKMDFRILTKSEEENKTYKTLTSIIDSIEKAQAEGMTFYPSPMLSGFNGWMQYDFNTSKIVPNISRIQGTERNY